MSEDLTIEPRRLCDTELGGINDNNVRQIADSMRRNGYFSSKPIRVYLYLGDYWIIEGHHRKKAAIQAEIDVKIRIVSESAMLLYFPSVTAMTQGKRVKPNYRSD